MVNFETDTIVQVSPRQTITYIYLQRSEELQLAWKTYYTLSFQNRNQTSAIADIRSCTIALFNRLKPSLRKSLPKEMYTKLLSNVMSDDIDKLQFAEQELEDYLYKKNITKIDSTKAYNPARVEEENAAYGL